jgi:hypothetical protein
MARSRHLHARRAAAIDVAHANCVLRHVEGGQVLAECAGRGKMRREIGPFGAPGRIVFERILVQRLIRAAVMDLVALFVARNARARDEHGTDDRCLGCYGTAESFSGPKRYRDAAQDMQNFSQFPLRPMQPAQTVAHTRSCTLGQPRLSARRARKSVREEA